MSETVAGEPIHPISILGIMVLLCHNCGGPCEVLRLGDDAVAHMRCLNCGNLFTAGTVNSKEAS